MCSLIFTACCCFFWRKKVCYFVLSFRFVSLLQRRRRLSDWRTATRSSGRSLELSCQTTPSRCTCRSAANSRRATGILTRPSKWRKPSLTRTGKSFDTAAICDRDCQSSAKTDRTLPTFERRHHCPLILLFFVWLLSRFLVWYKTTTQSSFKIR